MSEAQVTWLEAQIDALNARLEPLKSFILPGGSQAAAYLHQARTVTRRAERLTSALADQRKLPQRPKISEPLIRSAVCYGTDCQ